MLKFVAAEFGEEHKQPWAAKWIRDAFQALEILLQKSAGTFCIGDDVSMADLYLVPQVTSQCDQTDVS